VDPDHLVAEPPHEWLLDHESLSSAAHFETATALTAVPKGLLARGYVVDDEGDARVGLMLRNFWLSRSAGPPMPGRRAASG
jgi:hypothetical protein